MGIEELKSLSAAVPEEVAKYQYRAIPLFTVDGESTAGATDTPAIIGEQPQWTDITIANDMATLGYFRQGHWKFGIRTLNKQGNILATGWTTENAPDGVYLQKGKQNLVRITLHPDDATGSSGQSVNTGKVKIGFETNYLAELDKAFIKLEINKVKIDGTYEDVKLWPLKNDTWTTTKAGVNDTGILAPTGTFGKIVGKGRIRYYAETPDLVPVQQEYEDPITHEKTKVTAFTGGIAPGNYLVRVLLCVKDDKGNDKIIAGQLVAVRVVGGENSYVTGTLTPEVYIETGISITVAENIDGSISPTDDVFLLKTDTLSSASITMKYVTTKVPTNSKIKYEWRINGNLIVDATNATLTFKPTIYGDNKITCVATSTIGETGIFGEIGSATTVIRVTPATGPNV